MIQNNEKLQLDVEKLQETVEKLVRRVDSLQKSIDLVYSDRDILEDLQGSMAALKSILISHKSHIDTAVKDVKAEVMEKGDVTEGKVESLTDKVISTIGKALEKRANKLPVKRPGFWARLLHRG